MIIKQTKGTSHLPLLQYQFKKVDTNEAKLIGGNMLGNDANCLAREFEISNKQRPSLKKNVYHASISIAPEENLTNNQFKEIAETFLNNMEFDNNQYVIFRHYDTDIQHVHIISSRVKLNGKVVSDKWDYRRAENLARKFEIEYNLQKVNNSYESPKKALSKGMIENFKRTGKIPIKTQLQHIVSDSLKDSTNIIDFINNIYDKGAIINFHVSGNKIFGASFELDGITFKASQLGKTYSWNNLKKHINYDERNYKSVVETNGRRKKTNSRSASGSFTSDQIKKHRAVNELSYTNRRINEQINSSSTKGNFRYAGATSELFQYSKYSEEEYGSSGKSSERTEKYSIQSEKNNITSSYNTRNIEQSIELLTGLCQVPKIIHPISSSNHITEEELKKKKKKKKRDLSNNDFYR